MGALSSVTRVAKKFEAGGRGMLGTAAGGIGTHTLMTAVDNVTGGNAQRIFSVNLPVLGPTGLIDFLTYIVYANGLKVSKRGIIALGAAKFVAGALPSLSGLVAGQSAAGGSSAVSAGGAGAPL